VGIGLVGPDPARPRPAAGGDTGPGLVGLVVIVVSAAFAGASGSIVVVVPEGRAPDGEVVRDVLAAAPLHSGH